MCDDEGGRGVEQRLSSPGRLGFVFLQTLCIVCRYKHPTFALVVVYMF